MDIPVDVFQIAKLASGKGCTVNAIQLNDTSMYWIENAHFIGKPYSCLEELAQLIHALPELLTIDSAVINSVS